MCQVSVDNMNEPKTQPTRGYLTATLLALGATLAGGLGGTLTEGAVRILLIVLALVLLAGAGAALAVASKSTRGGEVRGDHSN